MSTPSIPGVHRDDLADAIRRVTDDWLAAYHAADAALAYIATHHECAQQLVNPAIKNGWLVERVDTHTCGGSSNEWPYAHESGCGLIPVLDLSGLDGWQECDREHADEAERRDPGPAVVTDRDRTPDPIATIKPFRHPWITGDDSCGECGQFFRDHWWADAGDHGHTVCVLPEPDDEWVEVDADGWDDVPEGARVRTERQWGGAPRFFVHRDDLPDPDRDAVERMAKALFAFDHPGDDWGSESGDLRETYHKIARAALAAYREEGR